MKVFLCWSGDRSKGIAEALYEWLPKVIQRLEPWMSKESIKAGARWREEVAKHLELCSVGILCLTGDNLSSQWIHFEAGALAHKMEQSFVIPYVHGIEKSAVKDPLAQFQARKASRDETLDLLKTLNGALPEGKLSEKHLVEQFDAWWSKLEGKLADASKIAASEEAAKRETNDILEELVERIRNVESAVSAISPKSASLVPATATEATPGGVSKVVEPIPKVPARPPRSRK